MCFPASVCSVLLLLRLLLRCPCCFAFPLLRIQRLSRCTPLQRWRLLKRGAFCFGACAGVVLECGERSKGRSGEDGCHGGCNIDDNDGDAFQQHGAAERMLRMHAIARKDCPSRKSPPCAAKRLEIASWKKTSCPWCIFLPFAKMGCLATLGVRLHVMMAVNRGTMMSGGRQRKPRMTPTPGRARACG